MPYVSSGRAANVAPSDCAAEDNGAYMGYCLRRGASPDPSGGESFQISPILFPSQCEVKRGLAALLRNAVSLGGSSEPPRSILDGLFLCTFPKSNPPNLEPSLNLLPPQVGLTHSLLECLEESTHIMS